jgi:hypothetical protein
MCRVRADVEERRQILALTEQEFARRFFGDAAPELISQAHQAGFSGRFLGPVESENRSRLLRRQVRGARRPTSFFRRSLSLGAGKSAGVR